MNKKVFIFLAEGFEDIEAVTVIDLLRRADIEVTSVSLEKELAVRTAHDIIVMADVLFGDVKSFDADMIVLPGGGLGTENLKKHEGLREIILNYNNENKNIAAICAAPSVLGLLNILDGKKAACYPGFEEQLLGSEIINEPVVVDKNIITSRGPSTAIKFSLELIKILKGEKISDKIKSDILL